MKFPTGEDFEDLYALSVSRDRKKDNILKDIQGSRHAQIIKNRLANTLFLILLSKSLSNILIRRI